MDSTPLERDARAPSLASFALILLLFVGSGCAALLYEMVWFQMLEFTIGSSAVSIGMLLATFMAGLCLGSLIYPRVVPATWHPLRVYALLELAIGLLGLAVLTGIDYLGNLYVLSAVNVRWELMMRGVLCAACLLPPTMLMGATLPAVARWVEATPRGVSWLGLFYGGNTLGAVAGCLGAGFYLLRVYNVEVATYAAVAINFAVAIIALALSYRLSFVVPAANPAPSTDLSQTASWPIYITIAISGFCALGAEVIWTRLMSILLGGTTYTLSLILAVFLAGLGLGSSAAALVVRRLTSPRLALGWCQASLVLATAWCAASIVQGFPYLPLEHQFLGSLGTYLWLDLVRVAVALLPAACLWGASFPLALAAISATHADRGRMVGQLYAANTIGAIVGSLLFSLWLIPAIGTQDSQRLLIAGATLAALFMFLPNALGASPARSDTSSPYPRSRARRFTGLAAVVGVSVLAGWSVAAMPFNRLAFGRIAEMIDPGVKELYRGEGINSTVAVSEHPNGLRSFHVSGKVEASTLVDDMRTQVILGTLPALIHPKPQSALVVGFGAGVTAGALIPYLGITRIVICEIEPLIPQKVGPFFEVANSSVAHDRFVEIVYDDARHFVTTTPEKFDIITSDSIHPWVKGAASLYTQEYFEQMRAHLTPGGIAVQWVPLYDTNVEAVRSAIATFFKVFPHGSVWSNGKRGKSFDVVLLGTSEPLRIDLDEIEGRMAQFDRSIVLQSLNYVEFKDAFDLLATFATEADDLKEWLDGAQINRDRNMRLQYLAGMTPHGIVFKAVHSEIMARYHFPASLFVGSDEHLAALKARIESANAGK